MSDRFEMYRLLGKTLATGRDVPSDFLRSKAAYNLKSLVGGDPISAEAKNQNECYDFKGEINVIITANTELTVNIDADNKAWDRRMLWIEYTCESVKKKDRIFLLGEALLKKEGPGILNWAIEGAGKLVTNGGQIPRSEEQTRRIEELLRESDSVRSFVESELVAAPARSVFAVQLYNAYLSFCDEMDW